VLKNKIAVVTGAASGIGAGVCRVLAGYGAFIAALDLNLEMAQKTIEDIRAAGGNGLSRELDISDGNSVKTVLDEIAEEKGRIDILVNAAGIALQSPLLNATEDIWDKTMNINAKGTFLCCQAAAKHMVARRSGKIVNISSRTSKIGEENNGIYCASKAAVNLLTQVLALELAKYGINVNAICPSLVSTEMIEKAVVKFSAEKGMTPTAFKEEWVREIPLGRMGEVWEIGEFVAFLCSEKANFLTGSAYNFDGGTTRI
jgi:NAD(P)-dependent dehydrogenase (short-subunit alcohol dehydrogenase family)